MSVRDLPALREDVFPTAAELREIAARDGIDAATTFIYRSILQSPRHAPFIRRIEELCRQGHSAAWDPDVDLVVVPGGFYRENPSSGADGRLVREEAEKLGCRTDLIPLVSTGGLQENATIICDWLSTHRDRRVILASLSKGGSDIKVALARPHARRAFAHVVGWINLCGIVDGSPMAEWLFSRSLFATLIRVYYRLLGQDLKFMHDMRYGPGSPLDFELRVPAHLRMISVEGFPLREHLTNFVARRCHQVLAPFGPNDCGLVLADVCALPGFIYPLWGADHYLRPKTDVRALITAILLYLAEDLH
ncbi:MAG TPA: hypothetical protein VF532_20350 [Candidatus Angelobacter sp.]